MMAKELSLSERVSELEGVVTRLIRDNEDAMSNIGSENLGAELSRRLNRLEPKYVTKSLTIDSSNSGRYSYTLNMGKTVTAVLSATWYRPTHSGDVKAITRVATDGQNVTVTSDTSGGVGDVITVAALI